MIDTIGENLLGVLNTLEFNIEEVKCVYARGFTSVYSIVDGSYLNPDSVAEWAAADARDDPTFKTMLTKIVLIGRYFLHRLLSTQHYLDWHAITELIIPCDLLRVKGLYNNSSIDRL